jgi:hypothetical protein
VARLTQMGPAPKDLASRLLAHVEMLPDLPGCWIWVGAWLPKGYGQIRVGSVVDGTRRQDLAHRISYETFVGPVPGGLQVLHECDVPPCIRSDHLYPGTPQRNTHDGMERGRIRRSEDTGRFFKQGELDG